MKPLKATILASLTQGSLGSFSIYSDAPIYNFDFVIRNPSAGDDNNCLAVSADPYYVAAHDQTQEQYCSFFRFAFDESDSSSWACMEDPNECDSINGKFESDGLCLTATSFEQGAHIELVDCDRGDELNVWHVE